MSTWPAGDLDAALRWAAGSGVDLDDQPEFAREYEHLTLVRAHLALHRRREAAAAHEAAGSAGHADLAGVLKPCSSDLESLRGSRRPIRLRPRGAAPASAHDARPRRRLLQPSTSWRRR